MKQGTAEGKGGIGSGRCTLSNIIDLHAELCAFVRGEPAAICTESMKEKNMYQISVPERSALYHPLDPTKTRLSNKVYSYLQMLNEENTEEERENAILQIICAEPVHAEEIRAVIARAVDRDLEKYDQQLHERTRLMIWMYVIGVALSVLGIALSIIADQLLLAIISFFGSMAVREAVSITLYERPEIKRKMKLLEPIKKIRVEVLRPDSQIQ